MSNVTINSLPTASTIDATNDLLPIYTNSLTATQAISRNTYLNLSSQPVGLTDSQTLTNKTLTSPTINGATLSGTLAGTYTIGGTPTFPATVVQTTTSQTLTNKTLTSPTINSPTITNATISADTLTGYTTSNSGTIYGIPVTTGVINSASTINGASLVANTITNSSILTGNLYTSKVYNPYKFSAYMGSTQTTVLTTWTKLQMNTKKFDTSSNYSTSTYGFTIPVTGYWQFGIVAQLISQAATPFLVSFSLDGTTEYLRGSEIPNTTGNITINGTMFESFTAGQIVYPMYYSGTAGKTLQTGPNPSYFYGYLVSAT